MQRKSHNVLFDSLLLMCFECWRQWSLSTCKLAKWHPWLQHPFLGDVSFVAAKLSCRQNAEQRLVLALMLMTDFIDWKIKSLWYRNRWPIAVASRWNDARSRRAPNKCLDPLRAHLKSHFFIFWIIWCRNKVPQFVLFLIYLIFF